MKKDSTKKTLYHFHSLARVLIVPAVLVALNVLITPLVVRWDLTADGQFTLGAASRKVIADLEHPITIKVFFSQEVPVELVGVRQDVADLVAEYQRLGHGKVMVEITDPGNNPAAVQEAARLGVPKVEFNTRGVNKLEISRGYAGLAVLYLKNAAPIPIIDATTNLEYDLTLAIRRLTRERPPRLGVATAHGEQLDPEIRQILSDEYELVDATLGAGTVEPAGLDGLLLPGPTQPFTDADLFTLDQYVMGGGALIALVDGVTIDEQTSSANANPGHLNRVLAAYGVTVNANIVADPLTAEILPFPTNNNRVIGIPYPAWPRFVRTTRTAWSGLNIEHPITAKLGSILLPWPSSLDIKNTDPAVNVTVLAQSSPQAVVFAAQQEPVLLAPQALDPATGANKGPQAVAVLLQGKLKSAFAGNPLPKEVNLSPDEIKLSADSASVLVVGNSRFLNMQLIRNYRAPENLHVVENSLDALLQDSALIAIRSRSGINRPLKSVPDQTALAIRYGNIFGGSALAAVAGLLAMLLRRRATRRAVANYSPSS